MAADLKIHVFKNGELTEDNFRAFFSNCLGSKWSSFPRDRTIADASTPEHKALEKPILHTEGVWVGEVSWLKALVFDDPETFVPGPVVKVRDAIGEDLPFVDDDLIARVREAMTESNETDYAVSSAEDVLAFLEKHRGKRAFCVSW